jgi:hemoglobin
MAEALDDAEIKGELRDEMWSRLYFTAAHMVNQPEKEPE